ncbi:MAG: glycogen debranching enzyme GlgX, partial [Verrucomicrobiae bacterium]|nr:glycogen debranching enzyme GlgX [Verrucomicrobiae bacterium]
VSYNDKHNEANGENNADGDNNNNSWNCGAEGPTADENVNRLRRRQRRNFLATLFLSQGVPMLNAGDEFGRTQKGNNNAYCQDNEISWLDWNHDEHAENLKEFTRRLIHFRHDHPVFRRPKFFQGRRIRGADIKDIMWFDTSGAEMTDEEWDTSFMRCLGMLLSGAGMDVRDAFGQPIRDATFLLLTNAHHEPVKFVLPGRKAVRWELFLNTADEKGFLGESVFLDSGAETELTERSLCLFKLAGGSDEQARTRSWTRENAD